jgi:ribosomal protein S18 acetylase RimI-like enzyme
LGRRVVDFALRQAVRAGGERLVLAVDAANAPALDVYQKGGLIEWERRTVFARFRRS